MLARLGNVLYWAGSLLAVPSQVSPSKFAGAAASLLACWMGGAFGQTLSEIPKEYRGTWCFERYKDGEAFHYPCRYPRYAGDLVIEARTITTMVASYPDCVPQVIFKLGDRDYLVRYECLDNLGREGKELHVERWRLIAPIYSGRGGTGPRLIISDPEHLEMNEENQP